jgi:hypothetical protein
MFENENHTGRMQWNDGVLIGFVAALVSTSILLLAGALTGRGLQILGDAGLTVLPSAVHAGTGISAGLSYLLSHTLVYMLAGVVAMGLAGLADRLPPLITGLILVILIIEFAFLVFLTESQASGRIDHTTWISLLIAHAVGDVVFAIGALRAHPGLRGTLVRGYEW